MGWPGNIGFICRSLYGYLQLGDIWGEVGGLGFRRERTLFGGLFIRIENIDVVFYREI